MGAHWRPLQITCSEFLCHSRAVAEVFNTFNAAMGKYCRRHADKRVAELKNDEATSVRAMLAARPPATEGRS